MIILTDEEIETASPERLRESLHFSRQENRNVWHENQIYRAERDAERAENERLMAALIFYAEPLHYISSFETLTCGCCSIDKEPAIHKDEGERARAALKEKP